MRLFFSNLATKLMVCYPSRYDLLQGSSPPLGHEPFIVIFVNCSVLILANYSIRALTLYVEEGRHVNYIMLYSLRLIAHACHMLFYYSIYMCVCVPSLYR